jgi:hypothetical protein
VSIEYVYVKDLPEPLRAGRMAKLREAIAHKKAIAPSHGYTRCFVYQGDNGDVQYITADDTEWNKVASGAPGLREVYDLTKDLEPQFAERRALHW